MVFGEIVLSIEIIATKTVSSELSCLNISPNDLESTLNAVPPMAIIVPRSQYQAAYGLALLETDNDLATQIVIWSIFDGTESRSPETNIQRYMMLLHRSEQLRWMNTDIRCL